MPDAVQPSQRARSSTTVTTTPSTPISVHRGDQPKPTLDEVRAKLEQKNEDIKAQVDALQDEVSTLGDVVKDAVRNRPLLVLGGLAAAGVLVGLWVGGWGKQRRKLPRDQQFLVDGFVKQVRKRIKRGEIDADDPSIARVLAAIASPPQRPSAPKKESGLLGSLVKTTVRVGLGIAVQKGLQKLADGSDTLDGTDGTGGAAESAPGVGDV
ncbi:MAG: hypothetical protein AAGJ10_10465 [Bacteroidota bacterium]